MHQLDWLDQAKADLMEITDYVADDNPEAALRLHDHIAQQVGVLAKQPKIGRLGRINGTRELVITGAPYIAFYRVDNEAKRVEVLNVIHTSRQWPPKGGR